MTKGLNNYITVYKKILAEGDIQIAYKALRKYMFTLKTHFEHELSGKYSFGNVSPGYMDYTYFPFFNDDLRNQKLRFGIVLNYLEMRFELWLMGQNGNVQAQYWRVLKDTKWNKGRTAMPQYSVLEVVLISNPDFDNLDHLTRVIEQKATCITLEVLDYLRSIA